VGAPQVVGLISVHLPLSAIALCVDCKGLLDHLVGAAEERKREGDIAARRERPSGCRAAEERDKFPPPHGASHPAETSGRAEGITFGDDVCCASQQN
jgi:hypothetical protein